MDWGILRILPCNYKNNQAILNLQIIFKHNARPKKALLHVVEIFCDSSKKGVK
jgi:hypothetical protein